MDKKVFTQTCFFIINLYLFVDLFVSHGVAVSEGDQEPSSCEFDSQGAPQNFDRYTKINLLPFDSVIDQPLHSNI